MIGVFGAILGVLVLITGVYLTYIGIQKKDFENILAGVILLTCFVVIIVYALNLVMTST